MVIVLYYYYQIKWMVSIRLILMIQTITVIFYNTYRLSPPPHLRLTNITALYEIANFSNVFSLISCFSCNVSSLSNRRSKLYAA